MKLAIIITTTRILAAKKSYWSIFPTVLVTWELKDMKLSVMGDWILAPNEIAPRMLAAKATAPKTRKVKALTLKKSAGRCISCLNLRMLLFTSNIHTCRETNEANYRTFWKPLIFLDC